MLCLTSPFNRWAMPPIEEIVFDTKACKDAFGDYEFYHNKHYIRVSAKSFSQLLPLIRIVAHEMVHLKVSIKYPHDKSQHGANWKRLAKQVCNHHGFDYLHF